MSDGSGDAASTRKAPASPQTSVPGASCAVRLEPERVVVPADCACCGGLASRVVREQGLAPALRVLVPYCGACHAHASAARTRSLMAAVSSGLLALTLAAGLPLLWQPPAAAVLAVIAALGSALPLTVAARTKYDAAAGHAASGRAAFFRADGALVCASADWGARLAAASQAGVVETRTRAPAFPRWAFAFPVVAALASVLLFKMHFPLVRVVNLTPTRVDIVVDGRAYGRVEPTSAESVTAGAALRLPAGRRSVAVIDADGRVVESVTVHVESGWEHLYAPANAEACFWVEPTGYGRRRAEGSQVELLPRTRTFWVLPHGIDYWFTAAPREGKDARSSGGVSMALRQGRCDEVSGFPPAR